MVTAGDGNFRGQSGATGLAWSYGVQKRSKLAAVSAAIGATLTVAAASAAHAVDLPGATSVVHCSVFGGTIDDATSCSTASESAQISFGPTPTLTASANYPGNLARINVGANAMLTYSFAVDGGAPGDRVHLDIATLLSWATDGNPNSYAFSRVIVTSGLGEVTGNICTNSCGPGSGIRDYGQVLHLDALSGAINTVAMDISASPAFSQDATYVTVSADPLISIDPTTPNAGAYSLQFSAGIGNGAPASAPEPASWALMIGGFGLAGGALRRRRMGQGPYRRASRTPA